MMKMSFCVIVIVIGYATYYYVLVVDLTKKRKY